MDPTYPSALLLTLGLTLLAGCAATGLEQARKEGGQQLAAAALREAVEGNTLHLDQYGELADLELYAGGRLKAENYQGSTDQGSWKIDGDGRLCLKFTRWAHGDRLCAAVYQVGEEYRQFAANGALVSTFTVTPGTSAPPAPQPQRPAGKSPGNPPTPAGLSGPDAAAARQPGAGPAPDPHAREDLRFILQELAKDCPGCDLAGIRLPGADLLRARLAGADLRGADLSRANLRRADLREADLAGIDLTGADLGGADLQGADLTGARLTGANFHQANLKGAVLERALDANLKGAVQ